ncbi:hypothetical protein BCAR13_1840002 [Paraburkholderia caribensis]|nr:hypothetical protein BCAR13_1840002 [Paraburkholderia caribensis]
MPVILALTRRQAATSGRSRSPSNSNIQGLVCPTLNGRSPSRSQAALPLRGHMLPFVIITGWPLEWRFIVGTRRPERRVSSGSEPYIVDRNSSPEAGSMLDAGRRGEWRLPVRASSAFMDLMHGTITFVCAACRIEHDVR